MYNSRLPKSASTRPSHASDRSTTLYGSNIPVSVRKANLFTPQAKRSLQAGLSSTSRKSYTASEKKYQRPAPDRDEQMAMFESLVDFLRENAPGFPLPDAKRFFSSVSTTETSRIFEFLISRLFPQFKINKLEVDVPEAMALLEYPHIRSVTKSSLVSITTRQAIVNLLVMFNWLVAHIKERILLDPTVDHPPSVKIFNDIMVNSDNENMMELDSNQTLLLALESDFQKARDDFEHIKARAKEIDDPKLEERNLRGELEEWKRYEKELYDHVSPINNRLNDLKTELKEPELEYEEKCREHEILILGDLEDDQGPLSDIKNSIDRLTKETSLLELEETEVEQKCQQAIQEALSELEEDKQRSEHQSQSLDKQIERLTRDYSSRKSKLDQALKDDSRHIQLNSDLLRNVLEKYRQQTISIVNDAQVEQSRWENLEKVCEENNKVAKDAVRMLVLKKNK